MTLTLEIENKNRKDFNRLVNRLGKKLAPTQYPEYKKCIRKSCLDEYKEYEEKLPSQLEKITKCMFNQNREKCFDQYYLPIINPLINCSKDKCSQQMKKLVNKLKEKSKRNSKSETESTSESTSDSELKTKKVKTHKKYTRMVKPRLIKSNKINKKIRYYSESKAEHPQSGESKPDFSSSEFSHEISTQEEKKNKKGDRLKAIFGDQNKQMSNVSLGRLDAQISESTIGMHVESSK